MTHPAWVTRFFQLRKWLNGNYRGAIHKLIAGLTPVQIALVTGVFVFTLIGAILLALVLKRWNARQAARRA